MLEVLYDLVMHEGFCLGGSAGSTSPEP